VDQGWKRPLPHFLLQDRGRVFLRLAGVDDQRQAGFAGHGDVNAEQGLLRGAVRMLVIVVESRLADANDLRMLGGGQQRLRP
jgi:hypothetical protein